MNFYLSAIDDLLRHPDDKPTVGIILCKSKNKVVADMPSATFESQSAFRNTA